MVVFCGEFQPTCGDICSDIYGEFQPICSDNRSNIYSIINLQKNLQKRKRPKKASMGQEYSRNGCIYAGETGSRIVGQMPMHKKGSGRVHVPAKGSRSPAGGIC